MLQTYTRYLARPLASDMALLGAAAILGVTGIASAAILRGMDGVVVAAAFTTIISVLNIIVLKRVTAKTARGKPGKKR